MVVDVLVSLAWPTEKHTQERQYGQVGVKGLSVGALQSSTVGLRLQDTGYNLQDTGIEGCRCKDAG